MTIDPLQLLRRLTLGAPAGPQGSAPGTSVESGSFAELLQAARNGELTSKLPVSVDPGVGVELSDEQLARVSLAADKAEAAGVRTALLIIDGQRLTLDVHGRRITGRAEEAGGVVTGVDGVIDLDASAKPRHATGLFGPLVTASEGVGGKPGIAPAPAAISNESLLRILADRAERDSAA